MNAVSPIARHHARAFALQALYQWQLSGTPTHEIEADFLANQIRQKTDRAYFSELLRGVAATHTELDHAFVPFLKTPLVDLDPIELTVLRLATYELAKRPDIPWRVIINEALELAKKFGAHDGHKFVNGVLDHVARQLRPAETHE